MPSERRSPPSESTPPRDPATIANSILPLRLRLQLLGAALDPSAQRRAAESGRTLTIDVDLRDRIVEFLRALAASALDCPTAATEDLRQVMCLLGIREDEGGDRAYVRCDAEGTRISEPLDAALRRHAYHADARLRTDVMDAARRALRGESQTIPAPDFTGPTAAMGWRIAAKAILGPTGTVDALRHRAARAPDGDALSLLRQHPFRPGAERSALRADVVAYVAALVGATVADEARHREERRRAELAAKTAQSARRDPRRTSAGIVRVARRIAATAD